MIEYLWRWSFRDDMATVKIGVYQADAYPDAKDPAARAGMMFGLDADVHVYARGFSDDDPTYDVTINAGSMSVDIDRAVLKHDTYGQAVAVAKAIVEYLDSGCTLADVGTKLDLPYSGRATTRRFGDD